MRRSGKTTLTLPPLEEARAAREAEKGGCPVVCYAEDEREPGGWRVWLITRYTGRAAVQRFRKIQKKRGIYVSEWWSGWNA